MSQLIGNFSADKTFVGSLESIELRACNLRDDSSYPLLNETLKQFPRLKHISLIGAGIGENLDMLYETLRGPQIKSIDLTANGLMKQYVSVGFKWMVNFEQLKELNLSSNWFVADGLFEVKDEFLKFQQLRTLKIA